MFKGTDPAGLQVRCAVERQGFAKKPYLKEALPEADLELMNGIKAVFDPKNLLNPHKIAQA